MEGSLSPLKWDIFLGDMENVKKIVAFCSMIMVLAMAAVSVSAAAPNFAGTWVLDKDKSQGVQGPQGGGVPDITLVVTQDDKKLVAEEKRSMNGQAAPSRPNTYNLDGSETTAELTGRMSGTAKMKAKWVKDTLELSSVANVSIQGNDVTITTTEHWELADGGKTLKIHRVRETPRGTQESTLVFTKQ